METKCFWAGEVAVVNGNVIRPNKPGIVSNVPTVSSTIQNLDSSFIVAVEVKAILGVTGVNLYVHRTRVDNEAMPTGFSMRVGNLYKARTVDTKAVAISSSSAPSTGNGASINGHVLCCVAHDYI